VSGQLHAPAALPPGKEPWYPLDRRLGGNIILVYVCTFQNMESTDKQHAIILSGCILLCFVVINI
jgi:hypothetical protein